MKKQNQEFQLNMGAKKTKYVYTIKTRVFQNSFVLKMHN